jgi:signal transduction histidine kinase
VKRPVFPLRALGMKRIEPLEGPAPDGVGLGLCLCREIILDHGGEIWYEALPDGSNFVFTISREDECLEYSRPDVRLQAH